MHLQNEHTTAIHVAGLDGTLNWKYTWQTSPYVITHSTQNIERRAHLNISAKHKSAKYPHLHDEWQNVSITQLKKRTRNEKVCVCISFISWYFFFSAQLLLMFVSVCRELASLLEQFHWNFMGKKNEKKSDCIRHSSLSLVHDSHSRLHAPIKIVIQVNFESKNINKCHPFSHIVSFYMFMRVHAAKHRSFELYSDERKATENAITTRRTHIQTGETKLCWQLEPNANSIKYSSISHRERSFICTHMCRNHNGWHFLIVWTASVCLPFAANCWWCCLPFTRMDPHGSHQNYFMMCIMAGLNARLIA